MKRQKDKGKRQKWNLSHMVRWTGLYFVLLPFAFFLGTAGCSDNQKPTSRPSTVQDRQKSAMEDPFSYSPYSEKNDISGGDIDEWDEEGFKKDLDNVLNP